MTVEAMAVPTAVTASSMSSSATASPFVRALANTEDFMRSSPAMSTSAVSSPSAWRRRASASMPARPA